MTVKRSDTRPVVTIPPPPPGPVVVAKPLPAAVPKPTLLDTAKDRFEQVKSDAGQVKDLLVKTAEVYERIHSELGKSPVNRQKVLDLMGALPPKEYQAVLARMTGSGDLKAFTKGLGGEERSRFVEQLVLKGVTTKDGFKRVDGPGMPPNEPNLYRNDPKLPKELRTVVKQQNEAIGKKYFNEYANYVGRYTKQVGRAETVADVRKMGPPVKPAVLQDDSQFVGHPEYPASFDTGPLSNRSDLDAYKAMSSKMHKLTGTREPGSFFLEGAVKVTRETKNGTKVGGEVGGSISSNGSTQGDYGAEVEKDGVIVGAGKGGKGKVGADVNGTGFEADTDGNIEVTVGVNKNVKAYAGGNKKEATFAGGVQIVGKVGGVEVEGKVGIGFQGITPAQVEWSLSQQNPGFFAEPPEREAGMSWKNLPAERRALFEKQYWTEKEWDAGH